jgi:hypothetical protein
MYSKPDPSCNKTHHTNICTVEVASADNDRADGFGKTKTVNTNANTHTKKFFDANKVSCLSSPYLNKANDAYK